MLNKESRTRVILTAFAYMGMKGQEPQESVNIALAESGYSLHTISVAERDELVQKVEQLNQVLDS